MPAAGQALADVVVRLADERELDAGPENAPNDWPAAPRSSSRTGPRSSPRSSAPVRPAPNERSAVDRRSPPAVTGPWSRNAAATRASSGDAGAWRAVRAGSAGSARRVGVGGPRMRPRRPAPARPERAAIGRSSRRLSPTISPTDRAPTAASSRRRSSAMARKNRSTISGVPRELGAQVLALRGDPGRARVEVALAGHVAADRHERGGPERELLRAEQRGDQQVATGLEAAVGPQRDPVAQVVAQQDLVDLGEAQLPRRADVLDRATAATRRSRRRAPTGGCTSRRPWRRRPRSSRRPGRRRA